MQRLCHEATQCAKTAQRQALQGETTPGASTSPEISGNICARHRRVTQFGLCQSRAERVPPNVCNLHEKAGKTAEFSCRMAVCGGVVFPGAFWHVRCYILTMMIL